MIDNLLFLLGLIIGIVLLFVPKLRWLGIVIIVCYLGMVALAFFGCGAD